MAGWGNTIYNVKESGSPILLQARLRVISDCSMYFAYDPQKQICTAPNGPVDKDHGFASPMGLSLIISYSIL